MITDANTVNGHVVAKAGVWLEMSDQFDNRRNRDRAAQKLPVRGIVARCGPVDPLDTVALTNKPLNGLAHIFIAHIKSPIQ